MNIRLPKVGDRVNVIEKINYGNGKLTTGKVMRLLSNPQEVHPRGNKVMLENGTVGRMVSFVDEAGVQSYVDPARREKYTQEIRSNFQPNFQRPTRPPFRSNNSYNNRTGGDNRQNFSRPPRPSFQPERRPLTPQEEPIRKVDPADLPGEDDLR